MNFHSRPFLSPETQTQRESGGGAGRIAREWGPEIGLQLKNLSVSTTRKSEHKCLQLLL